MLKMDMDRFGTCPINKNNPAGGTSDSDTKAP